MSEGLRGGGLILRLWLVAAGSFVAVGCSRRRTSGCGELLRLQPEGVAGAGGFAPTGPTSSDSSRQNRPTPETPTLVGKTPRSPGVRPGGA